MGCLLYIAFVAIQLSSTLAVGTVPLHCFIQNENFFNIFRRETKLPSHDDHKISPNYDVLRIKKINLYKDDWIFNTTDLEYRGLTKAIIDDYGFNFKSNIIHITFRSDMSVKCDYKTSGLLFSLPISGEGYCDVNLYNIQFGMIMPFDIVEECDQHFINLKSFHYFYDVQDNANITLSNLYYGDKKWSDKMHHLMNQHWKFITERYSPIFIDAAAENIFKMFRNNMLEMPLKGRKSC